MTEWLASYTPNNILYERSATTTTTTVATENGKTFFKPFPRATHDDVCAAELLWCGAVAVSVLISLNLTTITPRPRTVKLRDKVLLVFFCAHKLGAFLLVLHRCGQKYHNAWEYVKLIHDHTLTRISTLLTSGPTVIIDTDHYLDTNCVQNLHHQQCMIPVRNARLNFQISWF